MNLKESLKKYREVASYLFFGVATTLVNWLIYSFCLSLFHGAMTLSNSFAWLGAVLFAYITNKIFVFQSRAGSIPVLLKEFSLFLCARGISGILEIFLPTVLYQAGIRQEFFGIHGFTAKAVVSVLIIVLNYIFSKLLVFKK